MEKTVGPARRRRYGRHLPGLKRARAARGLTQQQLADRAGLERATVGHLEGGRRAAQDVTLAKLARALKVQPEVLTIPKEEPTLFPLTSEGRSVAAISAIRVIIDRIDRRLEEAVEGGAADFALAELGANLEADIWDRVVPEMRLMQGVGGMSREEAAAHEQVYAALVGLGVTVGEAFNAAARAFTTPGAQVVGFDRLQAAMEERERAQDRGRRSIEEARTA